MMKKLTSLTAGILLAGAGLSAHAATLTYTDSIATHRTDWTNTISFAQFNSALGTLVSVQLDFHSGLVTTLTVVNEAESASSGTAYTHMTLSVQDAGTHLLTPQIDLTSPGFDYVLDPGGFLTSGLLSRIGNSSTVYTSADILSEFTGSGSVSLDAITFTETLLANTGGNTYAQQVTTAGLDATVIYTYTTIPEPSAFGLLVLGLGALPFLRRNRR